MQQHTVRLSWQISGCLRRCRTIMVGQCRYEAFDHCGLTIMIRMLPGITKRAHPNLEIVYSTTGGKAQRVLHIKFRISVTKIYLLTAFNDQDIKLIFAIPSARPDSIDAWKLKFAVFWYNDGPLHHVLQSSRPERTIFSRPNIEKGRILDPIGDIAKILWAKCFAMRPVMNFSSERPTN